MGATLKRSFLIPQGEPKLRLPLFPIITSVIKPGTKTYRSTRSILEVLLLIKIASSRHVLSTTLLCLSICIIGSDLH